MQVGLKDKFSASMEKISLFFLPSLKIISTKYKFRIVEKLSEMDWIKGFFKKS